MHTIPWNWICRPKEEGGLGIKNMKDMNAKCLLELIWKLFNKDGLWCKVVRGKYEKECDWSKGVICKISNSNFFEGS